jgi:regulator of protease activity HflC (stomatin/prohibitin superfamily)
MHHFRTSLPQHYDHADAHANTHTVTMAALPTSLFRWVVPAAIGASVIQSSIYDVKGGTRAVIFDRVSGVKEQVVNEGTHFLVPWLQRAIVYDVRTRPRNISTTTGSKDLQMVTLTLRVLHRPEVKQLPKIYQVCDKLIHALQCRAQGGITDILTESFPRAESWSRLR